MTSAPPQPDSTGGEFSATQGDTRPGVMSPSGGPAAGKESGRNGSEQPAELCAGGGRHVVLRSWAWSPACALRGHRARATLQLTRVNSLTVHMLRKEPPAWGLTRGHYQTALTTVSTLV